MDEDFGLDSGFDDGGSLDLDTESTLDDTSFDTDYSLDDIGTDDFSGGSLEDTDFSSGAVDDDFESFNDSDLSDLDTDFSAEEMLTDTGSELDLSPDSIETDDFGDIETDLNLEEPGDSFDLDESVDGTETEPEFPADSDEGGYFEDIPNEVEPYVLEEAQTETTAEQTPLNRFPKRNRTTGRPMKRCGTICTSTTTGRWTIPSTVRIPSGRR